ncbi:hypothetical protein HMPREF2137_01505 [Hoylesella buccalis DNF00853]|uniref:Uncharacterized protein n=1 Tax=Hoylesella buccalis DNF00853 TaxID=1401074 RepID=A0A095ZPL0_9BACT|nr:hypothetical protein HMPREF2137_01505 [Hoylesella buccalis DNF00853]
MMNLIFFILCVVCYFQAVVPKDFFLHANMIRKCTTIPVIYPFISNKKLKFDVFSYEKNNLCYLFYIFAAYVIQFW